MKKNCRLEIYDSDYCEHNPQNNIYGMTINAPYENYVITELEDADGYFKYFGNFENISSFSNLTQIPF